MVRTRTVHFEIFPVILIDNGGTIRADIPFRRAESQYSIEQTGVTLAFIGGILSASVLITPSLVKMYARKSQFGQAFTFDNSFSDGVFRSSSRGWYVFSHTTLAIIFFFGHLWHAARSLFRDIWIGVDLYSSPSVEYGYNEKLGM